MNKKLRWITETAIMLALLVSLQALTKGFGQLVTGSCVNGILAITALYCGFGSGVTVALMMDWRIGLFVFAIFLAAYLTTRYVSLGSVLSAGSFGFIYAWLHWNEGIFPILVGLFLSGLVVWMHRANIRRLIKGEERKTNLFGKGKKQ